MNNPGRLACGLGVVTLLTIAGVEISKPANDNVESQGISAISADTNEATEDTLDMDEAEDLISEGGAVESVNGDTITIKTLANMARSGNIEAAEWVIDYCRGDFGEIDEKRLEEVGISIYEYEAFQNASEFACSRDIINNKEGAADEIADDVLEHSYRNVTNEDMVDWLNRGYFWSALNVLCKRAEKDGDIAYNSLFLKLISMSSDELKDFASQVYSYFLEEKVGEELKKRLEYLKNVYELKGGE
ncbi:MAG: hypothetical protein WCT36_04000 [Candidatus Gracilibacteria bacterium]|jgi:hypothetical protein